MPMFLMVPVLVFIAIFIIFIVFGVYFGKKGESNVIKKVYTYLVLFATLMMTIGGSVSVFMALADLISPNHYYQSFEEYKMSNTYEYTEEKEVKKPEISDEEWKKRYDEYIKIEEERTKNQALNTIIKSFGWIIIPLPFFIFYQRKLKEEKEEENHKQP